MQFIFPLEKVAELEGIDLRMVYRRLGRGEYVTAKIPLSSLTGQKRYGIPVWCLRETGRQVAMARDRRLGSVLGHTLGR